MQIKNYLLKLFFLLSFCVLLSSCVSLEPPHKRRDVPAQTTTTSQSVSHEAEEGSDDSEFSSLTDVLPVGDVVPGWKQVGKPEFFYPDNLYKYINGAAEQYFAYNFQQVVTASYQLGNDEEQTIIVDIYEMDNLLDGFGIYSSERSPGAEFKSIGTEGNLTGVEYLFWKDRFYVKMRSMAKGQKAVMEKFASDVAGKLPGSSDYPEILKAFPKEGMVEYSERYVARDLLGHSFLTTGFLVDYLMDGKESRLFLTVTEESEIARRTFERLREFFMVKGSVDGEITLGDGAFVGRQPHYGRSIIFWHTNYVGGLLSVRDDDVGKELLEALLNNLENVKAQR